MYLKKKPVKLENNFWIFKNSGKLKEQLLTGVLSGTKAPHIWEANNLRKTISLHTFRCTVVF